MIILGKSKSKSKKILFIVGWVEWMNERASEWADEWLYEWINWRNN